MRESPIRFFFKNAGYSYNPKTETKLRGRWRCARELAEAEASATARDLSFEWSQDDITNREFTDEGPEYYLWQCVCRDPSGAVLSSLGGVDFGYELDPRRWKWMDNYRRVVEAELAAEACSHA